MKNMCMLKKLLTDNKMRDEFLFIFVLMITIKFELGQIGVWNSKDVEILVANLRQARDTQN